jgi:serine/threonine protein kinase
LITGYIVRTIYAVIDPGGSPAEKDVKDALDILSNYTKLKAIDIDVIKGICGAAEFLFENMIFRGGESKDIALYVSNKYRVFTLDGANSQGSGNLQEIAMMLGGNKYEVGTKKDANTLESAMALGILPFPWIESGSYKSLERIVKRQKKIITGYAPDVRALNTGYRIMALHKLSRRYLMRVLAKNIEPEKVFRVRDLEVASMLQYILQDGTDRETIASSGGKTEEDLANAMNGIDISDTKKNVMHIISVAGEPIGVVPVQGKGTPEDDGGGDTDTEENEHPAEKYGTYDVLPSKRIPLGTDGGGNTGGGAHETGSPDLYNDIATPEVSSKSGQSSPAVITGSWPESRPELPETSPPLSLQTPQFSQPETPPLGSHNTPQGSPRAARVTPSAPPESPLDQRVSPSAPPESPVEKIWTPLYPTLTPFHGSGEGQTVPSGDAGQYSAEKTMSVDTPPNSITQPHGIAGSPISVDTPLNSTTQPHGSAGSSVSVDTPQDSTHQLSYGGSTPDTPAFHDRTVSYSQKQGGPLSPVAPRKHAVRLWDEFFDLKKSDPLFTGHMTLQKQNRKHEYEENGGSVLCNIAPSDVQYDEGVMRGLRGKFRWGDIIGSGAYGSVFKVGSKELVEFDKNTYYNSFAVKVMELVPVVTSRSAPSSGLDRLRLVSPAATDISVQYLINSLLGRGRDVMEKRENPIMCNFVRLYDWTTVRVPSEVKSKKRGALVSLRRESRKAPLSDVEGGEPGIIGALLGLEGQDNSMWVARDDTGSGKRDDGLVLQVVVMELCDGSVHDTVFKSFDAARSFLRPRPFRAFMVQVVATLSSLQDALNVAHGDMKLNNILVSRYYNTQQYEAIQGNGPLPHYVTDDARDGNTVLEYEVAGAGNKVLFYAHLADSSGLIYKLADFGLSSTSAMTAVESLQGYTESAASVSSRQFCTSRAQDVHMLGASIVFDIIRLCKRRVDSKRGVTTPDQRDENMARFLVDAADENVMGVLCDTIISVWLPPVGEAAHDPHLEGLEGLYTRTKQLLLRVIDYHGKDMGTADKAGIYAQASALLRDDGAVNIKLLYGRVVNSMVGVTPRKLLCHRFFDGARRKPDTGLKVVRAFSFMDISRYKNKASDPRALLPSPSFQPASSKRYTR